MLWVAQMKPPCGILIPFEALLSDCPPHRLVLEWFVDLAVGSLIWRSSVVVVVLPCFPDVRRRRSPIFAHFGETLGGLSAIRAFGHASLFARTNERLVDNNVSTYFALKVRSRPCGLANDDTGAVLESDCLTQASPSCLNYALGFSRSFRETRAFQEAEDVDGGAVPCSLVWTLAFGESASVRRGQNSLLATPFMPAD